LFDEGQDASAAMLNVFLNQPCTKVIVGDTHQQIYGWRFAVNSLEKVDFPVYHLTTSFRFNSEIASLATRILQWKRHYGSPAPIVITGMGNPDTKVATSATLARSNSTLLVKAIDLLIETRQIDKVYFEGRFETYTYADEGASLYDVLNLYLNKKQLIRDKLIASLSDMAALEEYIEKTEDRQLGLLADVVKKYGDRLPGLIKKIKDAHLEGDDKAKAGMIFSTVHKCKGMEYGTVTLADDFITEEKVKNGFKEIKSNPLFAARINEEINILYVAVTRTMGALHIPESLMPASSIHVMAPPPQPEPDVPDYYMPLHLNTDYEKPQRPALAGQPWKQADDEELTRMFCEGKTVKEIAKAFNRSRGAIESRIKKLELRDIYGIE
jgi:F-box protein, helicase, 18